MKCYNCGKKGYKKMPIKESPKDSRVKAPFCFRCYSKYFPERAEDERRELRDIYETDELRYN